MEGKNNITLLLQARRHRGYEIAKTHKVVNQNGLWLVPSQTNPRQVYKVAFRMEGATCTCQDFLDRGIRCKHIFAVDITISKQIDAKGNTIITTTKRVQYPQNWSAYNLSQITEKEVFMKLINDLCKDIDEPLYRFGRPQLSMKDMIFASTLKVYTTFSLRRFMTDMRTALEKGYITQNCSYSSVSNYMRDEELTPILERLIMLSSLPLRSLETKFAIDSSGFRTTKFNDYCREKHKTDKEHEWVKLHICTGVKTNIITSAKVGFGYDSDNTQFVPLAEDTYKTGFNIEELSADKAYSSRDNVDYTHKIGAMPYIPFRSNATGKSRGSYTWMRMFRYFTYNRDEFLEHYHLRSNVESTFNMLKSKFTDLIRSKDKTAQINEALLKCLCHNIVVIVQSMNEFGIEANFLNA